MPLLTYFFFGWVGPWVGELVGFIIIFIGVPTQQNVVYGEHPIIPGRSKHLGKAQQGFPSEALFGRGVTDTR